MNLDKLQIADDLFKKQDIGSYDVLVLAILNTLESYKLETGTPMTWEFYLEYAKKQKQGTLQNSNNVKQKVTK